MDAKLPADQQLKAGVKSEQPESVLLERQEQPQNVQQQLSQLIKTSPRVQVSRLGGPLLSDLGRGAQITAGMPQVLNRHLQLDVDLLEDQPLSQKRQSQSNEEQKEESKNEVRPAQESDHDHAFDISQLVPVQSTLVQPINLIEDYG